MFFETCGDGPEMHDLIEIPLAKTALAVEKWAEGWDGDAVRHRFDVGPSAIASQAFRCRGRELTLGWRGLTVYARMITKP